MAIAYGYQISTEFSSLLNLLKLPFKGEDLTNNVKILELL
jgi:hypothetical protein